MTNIFAKLQREIIGAIADQATRDVRKTTERLLTDAETKRAEFQATTLEFGNELMFAVLGLETEPAGTKAVFEVELRGRKCTVTVEPKP